MAAIYVTTANSPYTISDTVVNYDIYVSDGATLTLQRCVVNGRINPNGSKTGTIKIVGGCTMSASVCCKDMQLG